ncbi:sigma-70 family RNA polymerase sigma factor [Pseudomonas abieticivorans]|uniref:sigma-70 family RNA polymerase sigma factor n=1 Tax=Pseudomonas abieticivorans TaxID=2931382 RepID=UPI003F691D9C
MTPGQGAGAPPFSDGLPLSVAEPQFDYEAHLAACARGERAALQRLYVQEVARLLGVAKRLVRDNALAEDVVHDAFVKVWQGAADFDPARGSARGWIFSITRHVALDGLRRRRRETPLDTFSELETPSEGNDVLLYTDRLHHCLAGLQPQRRRCIVHAYVDGLSHGQIAQQLGAPLGTVKAWIKRSLSALRECMG